MAPVRGGAGAGAGLGAGGRGQGGQPLRLVGGPAVPDVLLRYYTRSTVLQEYHYTEHPASSVHLADSHIAEPLHLGLARADHPAGPWTRVVEQPLEVDPGEDTVLYCTVLY